MLRGGSKGAGRGMSGADKDARTPLLRPLLLGNTNSRASHPHGDPMSKVLMSHPFHRAASPREKIIPGFKTSADQPAA